MITEKMGQPCKPGACAELQDCVPGLCSAVHLILSLDKQLPQGLQCPQPPRTKSVLKGKRKGGIAAQIKVTLRQ